MPLKNFYFSLQKLFNFLSNHFFIFKYGKYRKYYILGRFHSLYGFFIVLFPVFTVIVLDSFKLNIFEIIYYYIIFFIFIFFGRAFGCVINDFIDRKTDKLSERTKNRPLATGEVTYLEAFKFLCVLGLPLLIIFLLLPYHAKIMCIVSLYLIFIYPTVKRYFFAPSLILACTISSAIFIADLAVTKTVSLNGIFLFFVFGLLVIIHDVIYSFQDIEDDERNHIHSTARFCKHNHFKALSILTSILTVLLLILGFSNKFGYIYYILIILDMLYLFVSIYLVKIDQKKSCHNFFIPILIVEFCLWLIMIISKFLYV